MTGFLSYVHPHCVFAWFDSSRSILEKAWCSRCKTCHKPSLCLSILHMLKDTYLFSHPIHWQLAFSPLLSHTRWLNHLLRSFSMHSYSSSEVKKCFSWPSFTWCILVCKLTLRINVDMKQLSREMRKGAMYWRCKKSF